MSYYSDYPFTISEKTNCLEGLNFMKYQLVPRRIVIIAIAFLFSNVSLFGQSSENDSRPLLKGKKTIYITNTVTQQYRGYCSRLFSGQSGLTIVDDINKADLVLDVSYDSDYGVDKPRGGRDQNPVGSGSPNYNKPDYSRQRYVSSGKVTLRILARTGSAMDTVVWKKSKKRSNSYSGGIPRNMPASWDRLTVDSIPSHTLPTKDPLPGLTKAFLKAFAKAQ